MATTYTALTSIGNIREGSFTGHSAAKRANVSEVSVSGGVVVPPISHATGTTLTTKHSGRVINVDGGGTVIIPDSWVLNGHSVSVIAGGNITIRMEDTTNLVLYGVLLGGGTPDSLVLEAKDTIAVSPGVAGDYFTISSVDGGSTVHVLGLVDDITNVTAT